MAYLAPELFRLFRFCMYDLGVCIMQLMASQNEERYSLLNILKGKCIWMFCTIQQSYGTSARLYMYE